MQEQLKKLKRNNLIIIQIKTMATIVNAYETDIEKGNIPMAVAVPVPSAPPSFDIAPDDEGDVSAHRPSGFTAQIKYVRMVLNWLL